jgi:hypothetical protein
MLSNPWIILPWSNEPLWESRKSPLTSKRLWVEWAELIGADIWHLGIFPYALNKEMVHVFWKFNYYFLQELSPTTDLPWRVSSSHSSWLGMMHSKGHIVDVPNQHFLKGCAESCTNAIWRLEDIPASSLSGRW